MANVANSLPQTGSFRPAGYSSASQPARFSPHTPSPPMMPPMGNHYAPQGTMPGQHYYMPQHAQGQPYFGNPMSPNQHQGRPNMGFYPNQVMMGTQQPNHMPSGYYYHPQGAPAYPHHQQGLPPSMLGGGQFYGNNVPMPDAKPLPMSPTFEHQAGLYAHGSRGSFAMIRKTWRLR